MSGAQFTNLIRNRIHECAPDDSIETITVGALRRAADDMEGLCEALEAIADESVFSQLRFAEDTDTDYFMRCFKAVKERARAALAKARGETP